MNIIHRPRHLAASLILLALPLLALPSTTWATSSHHSLKAATPVIELIRQGGNIRPFSVALAADGTVTVAGGLPSHGAIVLQKAAVQGLLKLATAERFFALPRHITGKLVNPDIATLSITVVTPGESRTVTERGARNARFDQLFAVVMAVAQVS